MINDNIIFNLTFGCSTMHDVVFRTLVSPASRQPFSCADIEKKRLGQLLVCTVEKKKIENFDLIHCQQFSKDKTGIVI